ncbi:hypothetical protein K474DRAFT_1529094 [Panus rudis PR-1116 ss-1]|nr:hypothetical protein K474DRAFT_1529094 [Panus rudis PR-1116 ss-1]
MYARLIKTQYTDSRLTPVRILLLPYLRLIFIASSILGSYTTWVYGDGCERYIDLHGRTLESTPWTDNPEQEAYMGGKAMLPYRTQDVIRGSSNTMLTYADGSTVVASLVQRAIKIESWANTLGLRARDIVISSFYVGVAQAVNQAVITSDDDGILALGPIPPDNFELPVNQFASRLHRRSGNSNIVEQIRSLPQALSHYRITQGRSFLMRLLCPGETSHTFDDGKLSFIKFGSEWPFDVSEIDPRGSLRYMYISQIRVPLVPSFSQWKVSLLAIQFANKYNQFTERIYMDPNENPTPEPQEALIDCGMLYSYGSNVT